jgi:hypothetical protein
MHPLVMEQQKVKNQPLLMMMKKKTKTMMTMKNL